VAYFFIFGNNLASMFLISWPKMWSLWPVFAFFHLLGACLRPNHVVKDEHLSWSPICATQWWPCGWRNRL